MNLPNKIAIVTGASSGLGSAICASLIEKDTVVYGIARTAEKLNQVQQLLGDNFKPVVLDITNTAEISNWVKATFSKNYSPSILINNAGIGSFCKIDELSQEKWLEIMNVNLNGTFFISSQVIPLLKRNTESSHIINIGSILGSMTREEGAAYCSSKFGIAALSDVMFKELRHDNIKVTLVNPGSIDTDFFQSSGIEKHSNMLQAKDIANILIHILETPDNMLINEITLRPLNPKKS